MKKIIAVLGIALFAIVLFANTNSATTKGDLDLASLTALNQADAECESNPYGENFDNGKCSFSGNCWWQGPKDLNPTNDCDTAFSLP